MALIDLYNFHGLQFELHGQASAQASHPGLAMNIFSSLRSWRRSNRREYRRGQSALGFLSSQRSRVGEKTL